MGSVRGPSPAGRFEKIKNRGSFVEVEKQIAAGHTLWFAWSAGLSPNAAYFLY